MRVALAAFMHESNTFTTQKTGLTQFRDAHWDCGEASIEAWRDAHHEIGGMIEGCAAEDIEIVPILTASATPSGPVTKRAYERIVGDLLEGLEQAGDVDGILLALHGAMVAEALDDADGETLARLRAWAGEELPIVASLDMHANISPRMAENATALVAYRTYPHVDQRARGLECARLMGRILREGLKPRMALIKLPLLIHIVQQYTNAGPLAEVFAEVDRVAQLPGMVSASVAPGYIYSDVPEMGVSVLAISEESPEEAERAARGLARIIIDRRVLLNAVLPSVEEAVALAADTSGTVCLMDCGDNIGGGGPGDSTLLLSALLDAGLHGICCVLYDPESAKNCAAMGMDATVALEAGGKTDTLHGRPAPVMGVVRHLSDGKFVEAQPRHGGERTFDQGATAVIEMPQHDVIVLNSLRVMPTSLQQLLSLGLDPKSFRFIIVKGVTAPRAAYDEIADAVIAVDTPGVTKAGPESFAYKKRPVPMYPLEDVPDWRIHT